jgi:TPR repeat protein
VSKVFDKDVAVDCGAAPEDTWIVQYGFLSFGMNLMNLFCWGGRLMVRSVRLYLGVSVMTLMLPITLALAQQPRQPAAANALPPKPIASTDETYRKAEQYEKKKNYTEAMRLYRVAADQGNAPAQVAIGNLYTEGQGVSQSYAEALRWYRLAANQGNNEAQNDVGLFLVSGWGAPQDYSEGMRWLRKAADQGNEVAERNIGMLYLQGLGVTQNQAEAIRWFRQAAAKGDEDAKSALKFLGVK